MVRYTKTRALADSTDYFAYRSVDGKWELTSLDVEAIRFIPGRFREGTPTNNRLNIIIGLESWSCVFSNQSFKVITGSGVTLSSGNAELILPRDEVNSLAVACKLVNH